METISVNVLTDREFDGLVRTHFPERLDYKFITVEESKNDVDYLVTNIGIPPKYQDGTPPEKIAEWKQRDLDDFEKWLRNEEHSYVGKAQILEALCLRGVITPGNYLIRVSW